MALDSRRPERLATYEVGLGNDTWVKEEAEIRDFIWADD